MTATAERVEYRVKTPEAVISFPNLVNPRAGKKPTDKPKFGMTLLFYPDQIQKYLPGKADLTEMKQIAAAAGKEFHGAKFETLLKHGKLKSPFLTDSSQIEKWDWPEGTIFVRCSSLRKPGIVGPFKDPITGKAKILTDAEIEEHLYPGARVRASLRAYGWSAENNTNNGISFDVVNIQWLGDDTPLGNVVRVAADEEFDVARVADAADLDDAPAAAKPKAAASYADLL